MERERWLFLFQRLCRVARGCERRNVEHPDHIIIAVFLWAVTCDRAVNWATDPQHWPPRLRRFALPSQSCMSRRLNSPSVLALFDALAAELRRHDEPSAVRPIDAKPLPISRHSQDPEARFGRGAGGLDKGYKLYAIWPTGCVLPMSWSLEPMNASEPAVGCDLVKALSGRGLLLGDAAYDNNPLYQAAGDRGQQLLAARRYRRCRALGHHRHSPYRLRALSMLTEDRWRSFHRDRRREIETRFGNLTGFGGGLTHLPPWVRRLKRVRLWVHGKLLLNAARIIHNRQRKSADA